MEPQKPVQPTTPNDQAPTTDATGLPVDTNNDMPTITPEDSNTDIPSNNVDPNEVVPPATTPPAPEDALPGAFDPTTGQSAGPAPAPVPQFGSSDATQQTAASDPAAPAPAPDQLGSPAVHDAVDGDVPAGVFPAVTPASSPDKQSLGTSPEDAAARKNKLMMFALVAVVAVIILAVGLYALMAI